MIVSDQQIEYINQSLILYGVTSKDLRDDLLDHICTFIETNDSSDFATLYQQALQKFGGYANFQNLQRESNFQKFSKAQITLNKLKFTVGFTTTLLLIVSLIFKMMHWPYANVLLICTAALFTLITLPIHYYTKYKKSTYQLS